MYGPHGGEIPGVGKVELSWIQKPLPPVAIAGVASTAAPITPTSTKEDVSMDDEGDAMAQEEAASPGAGRARAQEMQDERNLDYDVADDNEWGVQ
jgi:RNA-binding protein 26